MGHLLKFADGAVNNRYSQWRFREIPTSKQGQFFLGMTRFSIYKLYLFVNKLIITMLYYDAFDRFPYRAEWLPHADIQARLRSRNGSVTSIKSYGTELLPRGDI